MGTAKSFEDINAKIAKGEAVVFTAEEFKALAERCSAEDLVDKVDVVTVATYAPMCSSGVFINFGHGSPPIRMETLSLNGVPVYGGVAAVDGYLGATAESQAQPGYGGGHVIEDLIAGRQVLLEASGKGTDCYPAKSVKTWVGKEDLNDFYFFNPRNAYQNYGAAVNSGKKRLCTYLGVIEPDGKSVSYATSGELSPLMNDPELRTIGKGSPVYMAGTEGTVIDAGTQYDTTVPVNAAGVPIRGARTLALKADAKKANPDFVAGARVEGYGISLFVGVAFAIPVLDAKIARSLSVRNKDITVLVKDYSKPERPVVLETNYEDLRSGQVAINGVTAKTSCTSSLAKARALCVELKAKVLDGTFPVRAPYEPLAPVGVVRPLTMRDAATEKEKASDARFGKVGYLRARCVDCGACAAHCPTGALTIGNPEWKLGYDDSLCTACGACAPSCMRDALRPAAR